MYFVWYGWFLCKHLALGRHFQIYFSSIMLCSHLWLWQDDFACLQSDNHLVLGGLSRDYLFTQVAHLPELKREILKQIVHVLKELLF